MITTLQSKPNSGRREPRATSAFGRDVLLLASLLAFGAIGWEHTYHSLLLGVSEGDGAADHLSHAFRDALLAFPIAFSAVVAGLRLGRRFGPIARAGLVSAAFGLLLIPSVRVHDWIDGALEGGGAVEHHHEAHGLEASTGFAGTLLHGLRDAAVGEIAAVPLMLFGLLLLERSTRDRRPRRLSRAVVVAATAVVAAFAFGGVSFAGSTAADQSRANADHVFQLTDNPGNWFDSGTDVAGTRSLIVARPGDTVRFEVGSMTNTVHTASSLLWPTGAAKMPFDQPHAYHGDEEVRVTTPGLYVFLCKLHPFMLGAVIVDDPATQGLDLGKTITLVNGATIPTASNLAFRILRAFFYITNPQNYQVYTATGSTWDPVYPAVPVLAYDEKSQPVFVSDLDAAFQSYFHEPVSLPAAVPPAGKGVGEVWVDTEYEQTAAKTKPGTATAVDASDWSVTRKVALPSVNMNNPHNMWTDRSQSVIYETEWFDNKLDVFDRKTGALIRNVTVGDAPAHVMTRVDTDQVHVSLNGEGSIVELSPFATKIDRKIEVQNSGNPGQPHAHWMSSDGHTMVTPNSNTNDSTVVHIVPGTIEPKVNTGILPIASGMMPDASKYYVSNYLSSTISVINLKTQHPTLIKNINLLANYDPISGSVSGGYGAFPIQTPVSPNGKWVFTADTLTGTVTIIDTATDTLVKSIPCDAGCHGINFGAKQGGGYYAYVTSKFSNEMLVIDPDPNRDGSAADAAVVGRVLLTDGKGTKSDDVVTGNAGMGGQGVLPIPIVYNGWVQNVPKNGEFKDLTCEQRHPLGDGNCG
jgi:DNA-binding beta-propeller fold protein YncE/plastocyanin